MNSSPLPLIPSPSLGRGGLNLPSPRLGGRAGEGGAFDFANILFAGPCNRFCPFCIGKEVPEAANENNLNVFPPRNWHAFTSEIRRHNICELVFTGTTTDPHLYKHEAKLINLARQDLPGIRISIHTNAALSLRKMAVFNEYDRACISLPSFNTDTYHKMMGSKNVPDLPEILRQAKIPVKVSCVVNEHNAHEVDGSASLTNHGFLQELAALGVKRAVLRRLYGDRRDFNLLQDRIPVRFYRDNPVYYINGLEVTVWNFDTATSRSINLFADGTIGSSYLLTETAELSRYGVAYPTTKLH